MLRQWHHSHVMYDIKSTTQVFHFNHLNSVLPYVPPIFSDYPNHHVAGVHCILQVQLLDLAHSFAHTFSDKKAASRPDVVCSLSEEKISSTFHLVHNHFTLARTHNFEKRMDLVHVSLVVALGKIIIREN